MVPNWSVTFTKHNVDIKCLRYDNAVLMLWVMLWENSPSIKE